MKSIIELIRSIVQKGKPIFGQIPYRKGENMELYPNTERIKKDLNWTPKTTLENGLKSTIEWYMKNEEAFS